MLISVDVALAYDYAVCWLQVNFGSPTRIFGLITQGRANYPQWTTGYKISYGNSTSNLVIMQNQEGNADMVGSRAG